MPIIPYIPAILGAMIQLARLLFDMAKAKKSDEIKECSYEIDKARQSGDVDKLIALIEKMRKTGKCD